MTVKSPEEYFSQQTYSVKHDDQEKSFTVAERAFIKKYLGVDEADVFTELGLEPVEPEVALSITQPEPKPVSIKLAEAQFIAENSEFEPTVALPEPVVLAPQPIIVESEDSDPMIAEPVVAEPMVVKPVITEPVVAKPEMVTPQVPICPPCETPPAIIPPAPVQPAPVMPVQPAPAMPYTAAMDEQTKAFLGVSSVPEALKTATPEIPTPVVQDPVPGAPLVETPSVPVPCVPATPTPVAPQQSTTPDQVATTTSKPAKPGSTSTSAAAPDFDPFFGVADEEPRLEDEMRLASEIQLVGFFVNKQEFAVPIIAVQEVIRQMPVTRLPAAPSLISGVINLRGRVTPLLNLREFLDINVAEVNHSFIVICRRRGLQVGLIIDRVHTMYRVSQKDIDWAVETHLGNADSVCGLLKSGDRLIGIISVDKIIDSILEDLEGL